MEWFNSIRRVKNKFIKQFYMLINQNNEVSSLKSKQKLGIKNSVD